MTESDFAGWDFFATSAGVGSSEEGSPDVQPEDGPAVRLASLPSPGHGLVAVLDPQAHVDAPHTTVALPADSPSAGTESGPGLTPIVVPLAVVAGAVLVAAASARRRRSR